MIFEVCANSYQSAMNAEAGGADRIELCSALDVGGLTPDYGMLKMVMKDVQLPVRVLIRPRSGNFTYSDSEFEGMKANIKLAKSMGCEGIVSGVLHKDFSLDVARTETLIALAKPMRFTFHRAFDWVQNPVEVLNQLKTLSVDTVLTAGCAENAVAGIPVLRQLIQASASGICVMPGGGITADNLRQFVEIGCTAVHSSASRVDLVGPRPPVAMNGLGLDDRRIQTTQIDKVKEMKKELRNCQ